MSEERLNEIKDSIELQMQVQQAVGYKNRYDDLLIEEIDLYNEVINLQQENKQLREELKAVRKGLSKVSVKRNKWKNRYYKEKMKNRKAKSYINNHMAHNCGMNCGDMNDLLQILDKRESNE